MLTISDRFLRGCRTLFPGSSGQRTRNSTARRESCFNPRAKVQRHTVTPLGTFANPDARFRHVHADIVGPLQPSRGFTYILTCVDRFTCWPEAFPITHITADTVSQTFISGWVARFRVPLTVTTDRGHQFDSRLWQSLQELLGCHHIRTTVYHPSVNGMVEPFHRQLKASLQAKESHY